MNKKYVINRAIVYLLVTVLVGGAIYLIDK